MPTQIRQLVAIMPACHSNGQSTAGRFTDIVGYTALMGKGSAKAFDIIVSAKKSRNHWWRSVEVGG